MWLKHALTAVLLVQHWESGTQSRKLMRPCEHQQYPPHLPETQRQMARSPERRRQAAANASCSVPKQLYSGPPIVSGQFHLQLERPVVPSLPRDAGATAATSAPGRSGCCAPATARPRSGFTAAAWLSGSGGAFPFEKRLSDEKVIYFLQRPDTASTFFSIPLVSAQVPHSCPHRAAFPSLPCPAGAGGFGGLQQCPASCSCSGK